MSSLDTMKEKIIAVMEDKGSITKTEAGIAAGYTKNRPVSNQILEDLVEDGIAEEFVSDRGNTLYRLSEDETPEVEEDSVDSEEDTATYPTLELPADDRGFGIEYDEAHRKWIIDIPYTDTVVTLAPGEQLLCINESNVWKVGVPSDVLRAINEYTRERGYSSFIITDMETNEGIESETELENNNKVIMFLEISRHNKAGC